MLQEHRAFNFSGSDCSVVEVFPISLNREAQLTNLHLKGVACGTGESSSTFTSNFFDKQHANFQAVRDRFCVVATMHRIETTYWRLIN